MLIAQGGQPEVIEDDDFGLPQLCQKLAVAAIAPGDGEFIQQPRQAQVAHTQPLATGLMGERAGNEAFADTGGARDEAIEMCPQPVPGGEFRHHRFIEAARCTVIDIFQAGVLAKCGQAQTGGEAFTIPVRRLLIEQQPQALLEAQGGDLRRLALLGECPGHAG